MHYAKSYSSIITCVLKLFAFAWLAFYNMCMQYVNLNIIVLKISFLQAWHEAKTFTVSGMEGF